MTGRIVCDADLTEWCLGLVDKGDIGFRWYYERYRVHGEKGRDLR